MLYPCVASARISQNPRVLFLSSYGYEWESVPKNLDGITEVLNGKALVDYVFMDTKRLLYEDVKEYIYKDIISRTQEDSYDYVIVADDAALTFALEFRDELFYGIPIIFEGINDENFAYSAAEDSLITGIVETFPLEDTIRLATMLYPKATKVIGITDDTVSGVGSTKQFFNCTSDFPNLIFDTINCSELTRAEIGDRLAECDKNTILIHLMMTVDTEGYTYTYTEAAEFVSSRANVPIFKADELGLGTSVIGGIMVSYHDMAADAASIVLSIINGADISDFNVQTATSFCAFDKEVMNRFGITKRMVAAAYDGDIRYVNDKQSFFSRHKSVLIPSVIIVALLVTFCIFTLKAAQSKRKLAEQLQNRKRMLDSLLDNIPGGLAMYRVRNVGQLSIETLYSSQGIPKLSGRTMEEYEEWIKGDLFANTVVPADLPRLRQVLTESLPIKKSFNIQFHSIGKDGHSVPVNMSAEWGHDEKDGSSIFYAVYLDNTEQEKVQQAERLAIEAKASNDAKSDFLSKMSHDIRTPLNAILGFTALARDEADVTENVGSYLNKINLSGEYLLGLVNDVLDMSKIESGMVELHEENVDWQKLLDSIAEIFGKMADEKGIKFITHFSIKQTPWIIVDELRIRQIYINLLNNAVKFSESGTEIHWTVTSEITGKDSVHTTCSVSDQGCGMSEEFMEKMFQPFVQGDSSHSMIGTGLGLTIIKNLINLMGGRIKVQSEVGIGSMFTFELNQKIGAPKAMPGKDMHKYDAVLKDAKILLCDDNDINIMVERKLLEKEGCLVDVALNGKVCLDKFIDSEENEYSAIIMDIRMPVMDGITATKEIRALNRTDALTIPIIAMSANAFTEEVDNSLRAGMNDYLAKPVEPLKLYRTLADKISSNMIKT